MSSTPNASHHLSAQIEHRHTGSWIPPTITWLANPSVFGVVVPTDDPDLIEFVSTGHLDVDTRVPRRAAMVIAAMSEHRHPLRATLERATWVRGRLKPLGQRIKAGKSVRAYCHGVFYLPDKNALAAVVSGLKPDKTQSWIADELIAKAANLASQHRARLEVLADEEAKKKIEEKVFIDGLSTEQRLPIEGVFEFDAAARNLQNPAVTIESLLDELPKAVIVSTRSSDTLRLQRAAAAAVTASKLLPARDGEYQGIVFGSAGSQSLRAVVSWNPYTGLPSYPEVRKAVERRLPHALKTPRLQTVAPPRFDTVISPTNEATGVSVIGGFDPRSPQWTFEWDDLLHDLERALGDYHFRAGQSRERVKAHGFEAIAWYQAFHSWSEETWGIYIDAEKLDDLVCSLFEDLRKQGLHTASYSLAAILAFGLVYEHELFHARVEAVLSWQELITLQPRQLRYNQRVYDALRETPEWLEEALANWWSWSWFRSEQIHSRLSSLARDAEALEQVVNMSLDLSPCGYRHWRLGHERETWRIFATQLCTARSKLSSPGIGLPLESALNGQLPFDSLPFDVPLRFVGRGQIAGHLQASPANFSVPSRRELELALKYYRHKVNSAGGKGSHEKWVGTDQRAFILPRRDPVSPTVFQNFLRHIGIDKSTYVHDVRPNL